MNERVFEGRIAGEIAPDDRARRERLRAAARALVGAVRAGLVRDGYVRIHGFGTFRLRPVAARNGRHPRTGERIRIPAGWRVMFRPAKALRERVEPDRAPSIPLAEPQASREAMLAGGAAATGPSAVGDAPQSDGQSLAEAASLRREGPEPSRSAAAAMAEPRAVARGPVVPTGAELESDSRVTRTTAALTREPASNEPSARGPDAVPDREVGAEVTSPRTVETGGRSPQVERAPASPWMQRTTLFALLLLLLFGLGWWSWPREESQPVMAGGGDDAAVADAATESTAADSAEAGTAEAGTTEAGTTEAGTTEAGSTEAGSTEAAKTEAADAGASTADAGAAIAPASETPTDEGAVEAAGAGAETGTRATGGQQTDKPETLATGQADALTPAPGTGRATAGEAQVASTDDVPATGASAAVREPATEPAAESVGTDEEGASVAASAAEEAAAASSAEPTASTPAASSSGSEVAAGTGEAGPWFAARDYTVRAGDTLWGLSDRNYVNPYFWPHIWNGNEAIADPDRLEVRQTIRLPALEGRPQALSANDRRSIARGYLRLYRFYQARGMANPQYALVGVRYFDASVLPEGLRASGAGRPADMLTALFRARLEAQFPLD